jgi:hypothetical protein
MSKVSVSWATRREGNDGYVLEEHRNAHGQRILRREFGPMRAALVPSFVGGRRKLVAMKAHNMGAEPIIEEEKDWTFIEDSSS